MNFLGLRPLLAQRLEEALHPHAAVIHAAELHESVRNALRTPAVALVYGESRVVERQGRRVSWEQTWHAVVVVRNVSDVRSGSGVIDEAGELMHRVIATLDGLSVPKFGQLAVTDARGHMIQDGLGFFPITFKTTFARDMTCASS
ncbi:MAG: hypothetical protein AB1332_06785 [Pseudomonadota bacterium]|jgi:hypothetical protein